MRKIKNRGFASMSKERLKEITTKGARKVHELGKAYKFTHEVAVRAGKKGKKKKKT